MYKSHCGSSINSLSGVIGRQVCKLQACVRLSNTFKSNCISAKKNHKMFFMKGYWSRDCRTHYHGEVGFEAALKLHFPSSFNCCAQK